MPVATYDDVLAIERVPLAERRIPPTPYEMLRAGAAIAPDAPALTFFARVSRFKEATVWSHRELFRRITQAGNLFRRLGVERDDAVAFILPNLPETHLAIWGGEAAGIAFAISPLLDDAAEELAVRPDRRLLEPTCLSEKSERGRVRRDRRAGAQHVVGR